MSVRCKQFPLEEATPGMVLSDNLLDGRGNVLLTQGATLTETTLGALRRHRIAMVPIAFDDGAEEDEETAETERARHRQRLAHLFRKPGDAIEDATGILEQYVRYYRLGEQSGQDEPI